MFSYPVEKIKLGDKFGMRKHPIHGNYTEHQGQDFKPEHKGVPGDPLLAFADGVVELSRWQGNHKGFGQYIVIEHVINDKIICSLYAHCHTLGVKVGQKVKCGQLIGTMGTTGDSTGPHCHFGIFECAFVDLYTEDKNPDRHYLYAVDPMKYLSQIGNENEYPTNLDQTHWEGAQAAWDEAHKTGLLDGTNPDGVMTRLMYAQAEYNKKHK